MRDSLTVSSLTFFLRGQEETELDAHQKRQQDREKKRALVSTEAEESAVRANKAAQYSVCGGGGWGVRSKQCKRGEVRDTTTLTSLFGCFAFSEGQSVRKRERERGTEEESGRERKRERERERERERMRVRHHQRDTQQDMLCTRDLPNTDTMRKAATFSAVRKREGGRNRERERERVRNREGERAKEREKKRERREGERERGREREKREEQREREKNKREIKPSPDRPWPWSRGAGRARGSASPWSGRWR